MIRYDIDYQPQPGGLQNRDKFSKSTFAAQFWIDQGRINHVVTVDGTRARGQDRRRIDMTAPQID